ncbi:MAG: type II secretion system protein [Desulfobacteraceae bacterium]|nr:MAG: type II secretion system protein [Desulfobacteraceae bacterium]
MKKSKNVLGNNQSGFTLIEIIAVLILLGVLAAVAVPKYINLQADAANKAAEAAVAEGIAQINQYAAKYILTNNGTLPTTLAHLTGMTNGLVTPYDAGDFTITFSAPASGAGIDVSASGKTGTSVAGATASRSNVPLPN